MSFVPNQPPTMPPGERRLAVVGEAPAVEECSWSRCPAGHEFARERWQGGKVVPVFRCPHCGTQAGGSTPIPSPFVGASGRLLNDTLARAGIRREQCFIGNVSRVPMQESEFSGPKIQSHLNDLQQELADFKPNCILLLGNQALRAFHSWHWRTATSRKADEEDARQLPLFPGEWIPRRSKKASGTSFDCKITDWRGSIFAGDTGPGLPSRKCVAAYHPAHVLRQPDWLAIFRKDVKRAVTDAAFPDLNLPQRSVILPATAADLVATLETLHRQRKPLSFDLEGYATSGVTVCSFASQPDQAYVVPIQHIDNTPWWSPADSHLVIAALRELLEDPEIPKVAHNFLYELFVMRWHYGITIRGLGGDTMLKWHELFAELDKALEVPVSILTRQPYWKYGRNAANDQELIAYNATDTCVTLEIDQLMEPLLEAGQRDHYHFNLSLLEPMSEMMFHGIRFDVEGRQNLIRQIQAEVFAVQGQLDRCARRNRPSLSDVIDAVALARRAGEVWDWPDLVKAAKPLWLQPYESGLEPTESDTP